VTDKDALLQICKSLGLKRISGAPIPLENEYIIRYRPNGAINITLGCGNSASGGYIGFRAEFGFDAAGKAVEHLVYE
jgi:hypothetical protein